MSSSTVDSHANGCVLMVLSPAKTLDLTPLSDREFSDEDVNADAIIEITNEYSNPLCDKAKTMLVCDAMKAKSEGELKTLLKLSASLAKTSHEVSICYSH